jgi:hypothetical protein
MSTPPTAGSAAPISAKTLGMLFEFTFNVARANVEGFSHEDSLRQPPTGNCLNWILGHIVATRQHTLGLIGIAPIWSQEETERYDRARGEPVLGDGPGVLRFDRIRADHERTQELLRAAWKELDAGRLSAPMPPDRNPFQLDTVGDMLAAFTFHEAYHAGQCGVLRRILGKDGAIR